MQPDSYIETTHFGAEDRTVWTVRLDGDVVMTGDTRGDPSGERAHEQALVWANANVPEASFVWKHSRVEAGDGT